MTMHRKYPRTPHLPWSPGRSDDDVGIEELSHFEGRVVVVTEKLDGENTTMYRDHIHARSLDSAHHPSRTWVKRLHARIAHEIPVGWRICGENLQARHSIPYRDLLGYFYVFSIWTDANEALSWEETLEWCNLLELPSVPVLLGPGLWDRRAVEAIRLDPERSEGYVVRVVDAFHYDAFPTSVAKWVRQGHVTTEDHWMHGAVVPNLLRSTSDQDQD